MSADRRKETLLAGLGAGTLDADGQRELAMLLKKPRRGRPKALLSQAEQLRTKHILVKFFEARLREDHEKEFPLMDFERAAKRMIYRKWLTPDEHNRVKELYANDPERLAAYGRLSDATADRYFRRGALKKNRDSGK